VKYILDTDTASYLTKKNFKVSRKASMSSDWGISVVTKYELLKGIQMRGSGPWAEDTHEFLEIAPVISFDRLAAISAAKVSAHLKSIGKPSGLADELIAGHALSLNATLVTNNVRHFEKIPGLRIESWL
jgi:tRNA(fMet)-specific endonuclease VapC